MVAGSPGNGASLARGGAWVNYHWNWGIFWEPAPNGTGNYLDMLLSGLVLTIETAICAWIIALLFGSVGRGDARTLPSKAALWVGSAYVEFFPQHAAVGLQFVFSWFFVFAGTAAAVMGAVAEADSQCAVLHRGDRGRAIHVGTRRRADARRHQLAAAGPENWRRPRSG